MTTTTAPQIRDQLVGESKIRILSVYVGEEQVAAAVQHTRRVWHTDSYTEEETFWHVTSTWGRTVQSSLPGLEARDEERVREWLLFLADLYNHAV